MGCTVGAPSASNSPSALSARAGKQKNTNNFEMNTICPFLVAPTLQVNKDKTRGKIRKSKEYKQILDNYKQFPSFWWHMRCREIKRRQGKNTKTKEYKQFLDKYNLPVSSCIYFARK